MSNVNPKGFVCSHLQVAETLGAFNYPKSEGCNMTAPPAWFGIQSCVGCVYGTHKVCSTASSTLHTYICISARQGLLYPMHAVPCWSSPSYKLICLSGATQLWSHNHCNYITLYLPLNCLAKLRSHLQDGLGWVTSCSHITAVHQVVVQVCSQTALDLSTSLSWSHFQAPQLWLLAFHLHRSTGTAWLVNQNWMPLLCYRLLICAWAAAHSAQRLQGWTELEIALLCWMVHFPHHPVCRLLFAVTWPSDGHLHWNLEIMQAAKGKQSLWWGTACWITGDYPIPIHISNDIICLLV